jgi:hypothetical protein
MDLETRARLYAVEILLSHMIGGKLRSLPQPGERAARALGTLLPDVERITVADGNPDAEAVLRGRVHSALAAIFDGALRQLE